MANANRSTLKLKQPAGIDPVMLQRRATQQRLSKARKSLEAFLFRLEALHADKSGAFRIMYPATPLLSDEARKKFIGIARTKRAAAEGCEVCAAWLVQTADLREKIETLRNTKLPEKDPDYNGPWVMPHHAIHAGKVHKRSYYYLDDVKRPTVPELLAEREAKRKARGAAFLEDFLQDTEDAAFAKSAADVPH